MPTMMNMREEAGLSQLSLSKCCESLSVKMVRDIEAGTLPLTRKTVREIAVALEVTDSDVIRATGSDMRLMRESAEITDAEMKSRTPCMKSYPGLSQGELSNRCPSISRSMMSSIELGKRDPSPLMMRELAEALGVPPRDVLHAVMSAHGL
jgi:transcriptional regulator with XRE-family HTH domain